MGIQPSWANQNPSAVCFLFFVFFGQNYRKNLPLATGFADLVTTMNTGGRCLREIRSPRDNAWVLHVGELRSISWALVKGTEAPILWSPDVKNWLIGKDSDAGKDWNQEKGTTENDMVGWHHWRDEHEFEQAPGVGDRQGSLACCSPWGRRELDMTERLNWNYYLVCSSQFDLCVCCF